MDNNIWLFRCKGDKARMDDTREYGLIEKLMFGYVLILYCNRGTKTERGNWGGGGEVLEGNKVEWDKGWQ